MSTAPTVMVRISLGWLTSGWRQIVVRPKAGA
jgi:hypothetical protein